MVSVPGPLLLKWNVGVLLGVLRVPRGGILREHSILTEEAQGHKPYRFKTINIRQAGWPDQEKRE
jgi:hypothetical protein